VGCAISATVATKQCRPSSGKARSIPDGHQNLNAPDLQSQWIIQALEVT